ncbi:hypothetical protein AB0393_28075 [Streptomyces cyaneofuscatus]|uniref:hypothetical protein n=1 Tax=Streptomyces cyaneofuscatus TaxID=66883 RepID=UPI00344DD6AB
MAKVTNSITGGVQTGTVIMTGTIGALRIDDAGRIEEMSPCAGPGGQDTELASITADLRTGLDRPGPRLAVLTRGECSVVHALLTLVEGAVLELAPVAAAVTGHLAERVAEHGEPLAELRAEAAALNRALDQRGPRLAVLSVGECAVAFQLLAALGPLRPDLQPVSRTVADRIAARSAEYDF